MEDRISYFTKKLYEIKGLPKILKDTLSVATALITGKNISKERIEARLIICSTCEYLRINNNILTCGICNCNLMKQDALYDLTRFEENQPLWGCKHASGSKWKEAGV